MRRAESVREAEKRKANFKMLIEKTVPSNPEDVVVELRKFGIELFRDPSLGIAMRAIDKDGKERRYALKKHLGVNDATIAKLESLKLQTDYVSVSDKKKAEAKTAVKSGPAVKHSSQPSKQSSKTAPANGKGISNALNAGGGSHGGTSQQGDVNPDGSRSYNSDDRDEQWRRRNGYHM